VGQNSPDWPSTEGFRKGYPLPFAQQESIHPEHGTLTIAPISGKYLLQLTYDDRGGGVGLSFCAPAACKRVLVPA
jgi:hypothetical protein